jgi:DNA modification methylase
MNDEIDQAMNDGADRELNNAAQSYEWSQDEGKIHQLLIIADAREHLKTLRKRDGFPLIIADPPYRIKSHKGFGVHGNRNYGNNMEPPEYGEWIPECLRLLSGSGAMFIFEDSDNYLKLTDFLQWSPEVAKDKPIVNPAVIWFKSFVKSHPGKGRYNKHYEPITYVTLSAVENCLFDNKPLRGLGSHFGGDVMEAPAVMKAVVPGQKPLKIIKRLIEVHTRPGDWVLDVFGGSLTTLKACQELGRNCVTIEINKETAEKAIKYRKLE